MYFNQISSVTGKVCGWQLVQIRIVFSMKQLLWEGKRASEGSKLKETRRNVGLRWRQINQLLLGDQKAHPSVACNSSFTSLISTSYI